LKDLTDKFVVAQLVMKFQFTKTSNGFRRGSDRFAENASFTQNYRISCTCKVLGKWHFSEIIQEEARKDPKFTLRKVITLPAHFYVEMKLQKRKEVLRYR